MGCSSQTPRVAAPAQADGLLGAQGAPASMRPSRGLLQGKQTLEDEAEDVLQRVQASLGESGPAGSKEQGCNSLQQVLELLQGGVARCPSAPQPLPAEQGGRPAMLQATRAQPCSNSCYSNSLQGQQSTEPLLLQQQQQRHCRLTAGSWGGCGERPPTRSSSRARHGTSDTGVLLGGSSSNISSSGTWAKRSAKAGRHSSTEGSADDIARSVRVLVEDAQLQLLQTSFAKRQEDLCAGLSQQGDNERHDPASFGAAAHQSQGSTAAVPLAAPAAAVGTPAVLGTRCTSQLGQGTPNNCVAGSSGGLAVVTMAPKSASSNVESRAIHDAAAEGKRQCWQLGVEELQERAWGGWRAVRASSNKRHSELLQRWQLHW